MRKPSPPLLLTLSLASLGLIGCGDAPTPDEVRARLASDLGHVLGETAAAAEGTTMPGAATFELVERALGQGGLGSTLRLASLADRLVPAVLRAPARAQRSGPLAFDEEPTGFDTDAIITELNQTIFTDANHLGDGIYDLPATLACEVTIDDGLGAPTTELDPACVTDWDKVDPRIRVEEDGSALRFALQLGAGHDEPLAFSLAPDSLAVSVDLDEAEAATEALASAFGEQAPNARLAGRLTGSLTVLGASHISAKLTIDRALAIAVADTGVDLDGPDALRLSSAAAQVLAVELDGTASTGAIALGLGATTVETPAPDGFELDLPGLSARAVIAPGQPLALTDISLGDRTATLAMNGVQALTIDLNPDHGRTLAATITSDPATGTETLTVAPRLDVQIAIDHAALGDTAPLYDVTRVFLDGSLRSSTGTAQVEVVTGTFVIATNPASYGVTATAGQCVTGEEQYEATTDEFYTAWTAGTCL